MSRRDLFAILLLAGACLAFFAPAVFGDRAVFTWNMDLWHPWRASATPEDLARPSRLTDCPRQFFIMRHLATEALREGRIPLWDRWIYAGTPFLANFQPAVFYPTNLALSFSGLGTADQMTAGSVLHFFVATSGAYVLVRLFGVGTAASLLCAIAFAFGPILVVRTGITTMPATGCWLPWALAMTRLWFDRGQARWWAGMVAALAMSALAGHFQVFVFTGYAWILFGIADGILRRRKLPRKRWAGWFVAGATALLVGAVHILPTAEFVPISQEADNSRDELISGTLHPWVLAQALVPDILGNPADMRAQKSGRDGIRISGGSAAHHLQVGNGFYFQTDHSTIMYVGILPLLLAAIVLCNPGDHRREAFFALVLAAAGILFCFPTPVLELGRFLPGLGFSRPDRATFLYGAGMAILASLGAQRLASSEGPGAKRHANVLAAVLGIAALAIAIVLALFADRLLPAPIVEMLGREYLARASWGAALVIAASTAVVILRAWGRIGAKTFLCACVLVLGLDIGWASGRLSILQPKESIFRDPVPGKSIDYLQTMQRRIGLFRIMRYEPARDPFTAIFPPSTPAYYRLEDVLGFDSLNTVLYQETIDAIDPGIILNRGNFRGPRNPNVFDSPILDLLGARYVLATGAPYLPGLELVHRSDLTIYENPGALPRAFLVDDVRVLPDAHAVLQAMSEKSFLPGSWAYSESPIPGLEGSSPPASTGSSANPADNPWAAAPGGTASGNSLSSPGSAEVEILDDEDVRVRVEAKRTALLVHVNSWYPGWKASVDGRGTPLYRVDHAFQGVVVEPGRHEVVFRYAPASFLWGAALSLAGILAIGAGTFYFRQTR